jgi:formylglycine-generating enzyme required for sulfatase activity
MRRTLTMAAMVLPLLSLAPLAAIRAEQASPRTLNDGYGEMLLVPAGAFQMGDSFGDGESRERPVHTVDLDAFYVGKLEITNAEWRRFRDDPAYDNPKYWPTGVPVPTRRITAAARRGVMRIR